jgi:NAD(P)-dependent dehydrogenase (short-subunit alcohol dehydrogenase family)
MDLFSLDGKVALVTGADSGLGRQFSEVMAEAGADVVCADIDQESARATAAVVQGLGRRGTAIGCDVTAEAEVEAMVRRTVEVLGRLDILFNNAGIADPQALLLHRYPTADWRAVLNVDLDGVFFCAREALKVRSRSSPTRSSISRRCGAWPVRPACSRRWRITPPRARWST